jgi:uncharacterized membrane protein YfcA
LLAAQAGPRVRIAPWIQLLWACAAFVSALCGIGGGLFAVPLLHYLVGLPLKRAVATSLCLVLALSGTATAVEFFHDGSGLRGEVVAALIAGGWLGARAGFRAAQRIDVLWLKRLFALLLALAAARIFMLDAFAGAPAQGALALSLSSAAAVLAIGFGGGFIAPLLGVGGGLFVIPALFLLLPGITYLEARACSMAMTIFVSAQSAQAYWRRGEIELAHVGGLVPATVVGALAGVFVVHVDGWVDTARALMGLLLLGLALRFLADVLRARRAPPR